MKVLHVLLSLLAFVAHAASAAAVVRYDDYGVLDFGSEAQVSIVDLNDHGQVLGSVDGRAFVWQSSTSFRYLDFLGRGVGVTAINDRGQIIGTGARGSFLASIGATHVDWLAFTPTRLNNTGTVLGGDARGWLTYQGGVSTRLDVPSRPNDLNDRGQIVGGTTNAENMPVAYIYDRDNGVRLIDASGSPLGVATRINRQGNLIGLPDSGNNGYFYSPQTGRYVEPANLGVRSFTLDLNDLDDVVGIEFAPELEAGSRGFLAVGASPAVDLNTLLDRVSARQWNVVSATDVNDAGQILATAIGRDGLLHRVLLTPGGTGGVCMPGKGTLAALLGR